MQNIFVKKYIILKAVSYKMYCIGTKIYQARIEAGLEQKELAEKLNYSQSSISRWEKNKIGCPAEAIRRVAEVTKKPIDWFFNEDNRKPMPTKELAIHDEEPIWPKQKQFEEVKAILLRIESTLDKILEVNEMHLEEALKQTAINSNLKRVLRSDK
jgi:transcriptional regulator with XRE-family HTH domain